MIDLRGAKVFRQQKQDPNFEGLTVSLDFTPTSPEWYKYPDVSILGKKI